MWIGIERAKQLSCSCSAVLLALVNAACSSPDTDDAEQGSSAQPDASNVTPDAPGAPGASGDVLPGSSAVPSAMDSAAGPVPDQVPAGPQCSGPRLDLTDIEASAGPYEQVPGDWSGVARLAARGPDVYLLGTAGLQVLHGGVAPAEKLVAEIGEFAVVGYSAGRNELIFDDTYAYFIVKAGIARAGLDGSPVQLLFEGMSDDGMLTDLLIWGDELFFGWGGKGIYRMPVAGGAQPVLLTDMLDFLGFTIANDTLYAGADNGLYSIPLAGGTPTLVTSYTSHILPSIGSISLQGQQLYWRDDEDVLTCPLSACAAPAALYGTAEDGLEIHGTRAYAIGESLQFAALQGSECGTLVAGSFPDALGAFAITDDAVYVLGTYDFDSSDVPLYRVPLP